MTQYCPNCNHEFAPDDTHCANCGKPRPPVIQKKPTLILNQAENDGEVTQPFSVLTPASAGNIPSETPVPAKPDGKGFIWGLPSEKDLAAQDAPAEADEDKTQPSLPTFWKCPQCVSLNPSTDDYCENCGALRPTARPENRTAITKDGKPHPVPPPGATVAAPAATGKSAIPAASSTGSSTGGSTGSSTGGEPQVTNPVQQSGSAKEPANTQLPAEVLAALAVEAPAAPKSGFQLVSSSMTDVGISRKGGTNEDSFYKVELVRNFESKPESFAFYMVADGMGGQAAGEVASRTAIETVGPQVLAELAGPWLSGQQLEVKKIDEVLQSAVSAAHSRLFEYNREEQIDSGTTVTACCVVGGSAVFANVGDSRTYLFRPAKPASAKPEDTTDPVLPLVPKQEIVAPGDRATRKLDAQTDKLDPIALKPKEPEAPKLIIERVTKDQSLVQHLVNEGELSIEDVYTDPRRNVILFALGAPDETVPVDTYHRELETGDIIVLCSDGLWEMMRDQAMAEIILAQPDLDQTARSLVKLANENGGADNITVILVRVL